ncbi:hypothetical protein [Xylocopilactobacillus apis]|uniref:ABC transporter permease n=1 Tax=Xylocopilactobacillus apis TaxID=2932183 RepID=A0AAU9D8K9_9LACO|nr:hypothetical protein [Xylocopilactobacillus apis]BDR57122.1 hypothetical protein KIMC2_16840 [Xylocopilactobacillus apis]
MNTFLNKAEQIPNKLFLLVAIVFSIGLFLLFTSVKERKINNLYLTSFRFTKKDKEKVLAEDRSYKYKSKEIRDWDLKKDEEESDYFIKKYQSLKSDNQEIFLKAEKESLIDSKFVEHTSFNNLDLPSYNLGKKTVNNYLIKHHERLESLNYSTDSAIFTMNVLEFLNTPLFFLLLFLLFPISYFKKFEDGRIRLILTQPAPRIKIVVEDYYLYLKNLLTVLGLTVAISFMTSFAISRKCSLLYPVRLTLLGTSQIVPIYLYLLILLIAFFFVGTFIYFMIYFLVLISKKVMAAVFLAIFICVGWNVLVVNNSQTLDAVNPMSYLNVEKLCKNIKSTDHIEDILESQYINSRTEKVSTVPPAAVPFNGNVMENPYYYANQSLAKKTQSIDLVLLPFILLLYSLILFAVCTFLIYRFEV